MRTTTRISHFSRPVLRAVALAAALVGLAGTAAAQEKVLRIGMTAGDIPRTSGQPDQGYEGNRFTGVPMYDSLVQWDLSQAEKPSEVIPGLALSWQVDANDKTKWFFKLRPGVKFHDGSAFTADAVVWNVQKVLDKQAKHYDAAQVGMTASRMPTLRSARKIDDLTVELTTSEPDAFLPINLTNLYMASPKHWEAKFAAAPANVTDATERSKAAWMAFAADPSGTGPFKAVAFKPRERLEMVKNPAYWDSKRIPKIDKVVLLPLPEVNSRTAALLSGQVDWIEAPAPDVMDTLKKRGFKIYSNIQPHLWPWQFSMLDNSPFKDKRLRQAANLCLDRESLKQMLSGMMVPATGVFEKGHPWRGNPSFDIKYDVKAGQELVKQAGYSAAKPVKVKVQTSASGSGQMQPLPMNEFIQESLKQCYIDVEFDVIEWNTLFSSWRLGAKDPSANNAHATNISAATMDPYFAVVRFVGTKSLPPLANNWGHFVTPEIDDLSNKARTAFEPTERDAAISALHAKLVEEAPFLFVAHDVGPRAISPKVSNVVQPQSWFIDLATMTMQ